MTLCLFQIRKWRIFVEHERMKKVSFIDKETIEIIQFPLKSICYCLLLKVNTFETQPYLFP